VGEGAGQALEAPHTIAEHAMLLHKLVVALHGLAVFLPPLLVCLPRVRSLLLIPLA